MNRAASNSLLAVAFSLGLAVSVQSTAAAAVLTAAVGGAPTGVIYVNFDGLPLGNAGGNSDGIGVSYSPDAETAAGAVSGRYAAPFISNGNGALFGAADGADATRYLTTGIGSVTLTLPGPEKYIGLLWGSVDSYNTLSLYDGVTLVASFTGNDVMLGPTGDQGVNGTYYVNINSDVAFDTVVASSTQYAFEFDNVAYNRNLVTDNVVHAPEPASLAIFGAGFFGLGALRRRRQR